MRATVSSKGQITLPRFVRDSLGLNVGSLVSLDLGEGEVRLRPAVAGTARRLGGSLGRYARRGRPKSVREIVKRKEARGAAAEGAPR